MEAPMAFVVVALTTLLGVTVSLNSAAVLTFAAACIAAYPGWRLVAANRKKVLAEAGAVANTAADARIAKAAELFATDNAVLREEMRGMRTEHSAEVAHLEGKVEALEHRCDQLTRVLIEHGLPVPPAVRPAN